MEKKQPLWVWGLMLIGGAGFAGVFTTMIGGGGALSPDARAMMVGSGAVVFLAMVTGVVLIVLHFLRGGRKDGGE